MHTYVGFLIEKFDRKKFEKFYKNTSREFSAQKNAEIFNSIYNKSLIDIENIWKENIQSYRL